MEKLNSDAAILKTAVMEKRIEITKIEDQLKNLDVKKFPEEAKKLQEELGLAKKQMEELAKKAAKLTGQLVEGANMAKLKEYLEKHKDYLNERERLIQEHNKKLEEIEAERVKAEKAGKTDQIETLDRLSVQVESDKNKSVAELDSEKFKKDNNVDYILANLQSTTVQTLDGLIAQLENVQLKSASAFDTAKVNEFIKSLKQLRDTSFDKKMSWMDSFGDSFKIIKERIKLESEYAESQRVAIEWEEKRKNAQNELSAAVGYHSNLVEKLTGIQWENNKASDSTIIDSIRQKGKEQGQSSIMIETNVQSFKESSTNVANLSQNLQSVSESSEMAGKMFGNAGEALKSFQGNASNAIAMVDMIIKGIHQTIVAMQQITTSVIELYDAFGKDTSIDSGIGKFNEAMGLLSNFDKYAFSGWEKLKSGDAMGAMADSITAVTSTIVKIAQWGDKKHQKNIENLQKQVKVLTDSYKDLGIAIQKAYSTDASKLIGDQNEKLEQQKALIQQQIAEEEKKKKTNKEQVEKWKDEIKEIDRTIQANKELQIDAIFGEDVKKAIENFANAYVKAWAAGDDKVKASKDLVKNMIKNMVIEAMKADIAAPMEKIRAKLVEFWSDGKIDGNEKSIIDGMAENVTHTLENKYGWADEYFIEEKDKANQNSTKGGFETMSQDTAQELSGRFTALQDQSLSQIVTLTDIKSEMAISGLSLQTLSNVADETRNILANSYMELQGINENTGAIIKPIKEMNERLDLIEKNTRAL